MRDIVYQATVNFKNKSETYVGLSSPPFFQRYRNHKKSFRLERYAHETTLSTFIWSLKEKNINFEISWKVIDRGKPYSSVTQECQLCLKEKFNIMFKQEISTLNKRNELASNCLHRMSSLLLKIK